MKREAAHNYFVVNQTVQSTERMEVFDRIPVTAIYEVLQIYQGVPLFFEAHMERFRQSATLTGTRIDKPDAEILEEIASLVDRNRCDHINVKLVSTLLDGKETFLTYFIPAEYPGSNAHREGVHTILFSGERASPNIKTIQGSFREQVKVAREASNAYEALLIDEGGNITEGSRSNVFFVGRDGTVYTSPASCVLVGVTRTMVIEICSRIGLSVLEKTIHTRDLMDIQGAFLTGTTVNVTPIRSIAMTHLGSANISLIRKIMAEYDKAITAYISARK